MADGPAASKFHIVYVNGSPDFRPTAFSWTTGSSRRQELAEATVAHIDQRRHFPPDGAQPHSGGQGRGRDSLGGRAADLGADLDQARYPSDLDPALCDWTAPAGPR